MGADVCPHNVSTTCAHVDGVAGGLRLVSFNKLWLVCRKGSCLSLCPDCLIEMDRIIPHMAAANEQSAEVCKCLSVVHQSSLFFCLTNI